MKYWKLWKMILKFISRLITIIILTLFFVCVGIDILKFYIGKISFNPDLSFNYSALKGANYNVESSIPKERIEKIKQRPIYHYIEVIYPNKEK